MLFPFIILTGNSTLRHPPSRPRIILEPPERRLARLGAAARRRARPRASRAERCARRSWPDRARRSRVATVRRTDAESSRRSRGRSAAGRRRNPSRCRRDRCPRSRRDRRYGRRRRTASRAARGPWRVSSSAICAFGSATSGALPERVARALEPVAQRLRDEARHEGRHHDAAIVLQAAQHVVGRVARMIAEREGVGMRQQDRRLADVEQPADALVARHARRRRSCRAGCTRRSRRGRTR